MDIKNWTWRKRIPEKGGDTAVINSLDNPPAKFVFGDHLRISDSAWRDERPAGNGDKAKAQAAAAVPTEVALKEAEVKQHAKVAEEAVAGWEKAEAEAESIKRQLEVEQKEKATLQERLSHLDGALKDCTRQVRLVREEQEQKRQELLQKKNKEVEKIRMEYEAKLAEVGRQLLEAGAENKVMAMTLQEQIRVTGEVTDSKSRAEAEIKILQQRVECLEKDKGVLKYEVHVLNKQLQIRNEDRVYSKRDIDNLNKQHTEDVKKIGRLEGECQRLRILVRRKLPGPNAVAQMKMEVESLDGAGEPRRLSRRSGLLSPDGMQTLRQAQNGGREIELLVERVLSMEEETKMLKEALAQRNGELHTSRLMCAKTATRLSALEAYFESVSRTHNVPKPKLNGVPAADCRATGTVNLPEDDEVSRADAWASALIAELSQFKKDKLLSSGNVIMQGPRTVDIMDDFTDMERLVDSTLLSDLTSEKTFESKTPTELTAEKTSPNKSPNGGGDEVGSPDVKACTEEELQLQLQVKRKLEPSLDALVGEGKVDDKTVPVELTESELTAAARRAVSLVEALAVTAGILSPEENSNTELESKMNSVNSLNKLSTWEFVNEVLDMFDIVLSELKTKSMNPDEPTKVDNATQTCDEEPINVLHLQQQIDSDKVELEMLRVEKVALETHMKTELSRLANLETELTELKSEKLHLQLDFDDGSQELERTRGKLRDAQQLIEELQTKLAASKEAMVITEVRAQASGSYMQDVVSRLEKELEEEYKNADVKTIPNQQEHPEPQPPATDEKKVRKEQEIAEAEEKLAECQRTILALGKQLKALSSPPQHSVESSMDSRVNSNLSIMRKYSESEGDQESEHHHASLSKGTTQGVRTQTVEEYSFSPMGSPMQQQKSRQQGNRDVQDYFSLEESASEHLSTSDISSPLRGGSSVKNKRSSFSRFFTRAKSSV